MLLQSVLVLSQVSPPARFIDTLMAFVAPLSSPSYLLHSSTVNAKGSCLQHYRIYCTLLTSVGHFLSSRCEWMWRQPVRMFSRELLTYVCILLVCTECPTSIRASCRKHVSK